MRVIVSLTTTATRTKLLEHTLLSLSSQSRKPDILLLNVSRDGYLADPGFAHTPGVAEQCGVEVNWVTNTGPYRKLIPALEIADDDDIIITADDDILYPSDWLSSLVDAGVHNPAYIVAARARRITRTPFGTWRNYSLWPDETRTVTGILLVPLGGAGTVYRKPLIDLDFIRDSAAMRLAPTNDDMWFRLASLRRNTQVAVLPPIGLESVYLLHSHRMSANINHKRPEVGNSALLDDSLRLWLRFRDYLGLSNTVSDRAWKASERYGRPHALSESSASSVR